MADEPSGPPDTYALGRSEEETERLILQARIYEPITRGFLVSAGITSGMSVLDVGSGAGDVAMTLAELVGLQGRVVGIDTNPGILHTARARVAAAGWTNVTFLEGDEAELAGDADFDAVVGRWVLMYQEDPARMLRRLASHLRPGGIVAFQENDLSYPPGAVPSGPVHDAVTRWAIPPPGAPGPDARMGLKLYGVYLEAGLPAPQLVLDAPVGGGDAWPGYRYLTDTVRSLLPFLEQMGMVRSDEVDIDTLEGRLRAEVVAQNGVHVLPVIIGAWTRRLGFDRSTG